mmetsp:Transcript_25406/g.38827  ORF Transcript_25406/g.38827 Transcript_25406/m.38827 type:complete len:94 (+) Transcript_25406:180-461(+)
MMHRYRHCRSRIQDRQEKLNRFNNFLDTIGVSKDQRKIEAAFVGDGMRLGAIATEDLQQEDIYLAMHDSFLRHQSSYYQRRDSRGIQEPKWYS